MQPTLTVRFYCSSAGKEPVREWLKADVSVDARKAIGADIKTVQFGWPVGMPVVRKMEADLWEVRSKIPGGIARVLFTNERGIEMKKNPHIGSSFDKFLAEDGQLNEATAVAVKRVIAWQIEQAMQAAGLNKSTLAKRMHTSRTVVDRILDSEDTGLTLVPAVSTRDLNRILFSPGAPRPSP